MNDDERPIGYDTLLEALAVLIEHERTQRREQTRTRLGLNFKDDQVFRGPVVPSA